MNKQILIGIMGGVILGLQGCGGASSSSSIGGSGTQTPTNPATTVQLSGAVVDWYITNALVFADLNKNSIHDAGEPSVRSDANGFFDLSQADITATDYDLVAKGGIDKATGNYYAATLLAERHYKNITPLTTLDTLLIRNHGYSSADADLIVQKLVGMEDKEDVVSLDANPATNKYLLSGARMLAMYNNVLTEVMSQVVQSSDTAVYSQDDIKVKISRDAWDQMAAQVDDEYREELKKEDGDKNKVEPEIKDKSLQFMVKLLLEKYQQQYNLTGVDYQTLMPDALATAIYDYVKSVTDYDFKLSDHAFGDDENADDEYMASKQTYQDREVVSLVQQYLATGTLPSIQIKGDDDEKEYGDDDDDHHG